MQQLLHPDYENREVYWKFRLLCDQCGEARITDRVRYLMLVEGGSARDTII